MSARLAIVGAADTAVGVVPGKSPTELCVEAAILALADAGIDKSAVDGLITCNAFAEPIMYHAEAIAEYLQIFPRMCVTAPTGGGTTFAAVTHAASAIASGVANTIVISMADSLRSSMTREQAMLTQSSTGHPQFEQPYGVSVPAYYALIARAHMAEFGTTEAQFAAAAVSGRAHAARNPTAQMRDLITRGRRAGVPAHRRSAASLGLFAGFRRRVGHCRDGGRTRTRLRGAPGLSARQRAKVTATST